MSNNCSYVLPKTKIWALHKSKSNDEYYYYNVLTGKSVWTRPQGLEDDDIHFPEGYTIPEKEQVKGVEAQLKNVLKEPVGDASDQKKNEQTNKKRKKRKKKPTTNVAKQSIALLKNCKGEKSADENHNISKSGLQKRLRTVAQKSNQITQEELPSYTDSDEDQPVVVDEAKNTDQTRNKFQSKQSESKSVIFEPKTFNSAHVGERKDGSSCERQCGSVIEENGINDQYEEMDWTPESPYNNSINEIESELGITEWASLRNEITPMEIDIDSPEHTCIVIDTNIMIHSFELFELLTKSDLADGSKIIMVIPWQVLQELDKLKLKSGFNDFIRREAIRFLHKCFNDKSKNVVAQNAHSAELCKKLIKIEVPDDNILACCLQVIGLDRRTVLLSNDLNLCNKANAHNIEAYTQNEFITKLPTSNLPAKITTNNRNINNSNKINVQNKGISENSLGTLPQNSLPVANSSSRFQSESPLIDLSLCNQTSFCKAQKPLPYSVVKNLLPRKNRQVPLQLDKEDKRSLTRPSSAQVQNPLSYSIGKNLLPRKTPKPTSQVEERGTSGKSAQALLSKGLTVLEPSSSPPVLSPSTNISCIHNQCQVRPKNQENEMPVEIKEEQQIEMFKFVKLSPTDFAMSNEFYKFKIIVAEFLFSILKEGMNKIFKNDWSKFIIIKPPWTVDQMCICLHAHWILFTNKFPTNDIHKKLQSLKDFICNVGNENITLEDLVMATNICFSISSTLKKDFRKTVEKFDAQLISLLPKSFEHCEKDIPSLEDTKEVPHLLESSILPIDTESSRCCDILSRILNETTEFLECLNRNVVNCINSGMIDYGSPWIPVLSDMIKVLPKKIRLTTNIICFLVGIIQPGSVIQESLIDKITLCLTEGTNLSDPFFSKEDVKIFAIQPSNRDLVQQYWIKYDKLRTELLAISKNLVNFRLVITM